MYAQQVCTVAVLHYSSDASDAVEAAKCCHAMHNIQNYLNCCHQSSIMHASLDLCRRAELRMRIACFG